MTIPMSGSLLHEHQPSWLGAKLMLTWLWVLENMTYFF